MPDILYEHPLNERIRNYLKLEQLFVQARSCLAQEIAISHAQFFSSIFSILDTLERTDTRGEAIKDLEKLEQNLLQWSCSPNIDKNALTTTLEQTKGLITLLRSKNSLWCSLKEDKFLFSVRKRFALQNAYCTFDLPSLAFWLNQPPILVQNDMDKWLSALNPVEQSLNLILKFLRQRGEFLNIQSENSFYQDNGEGLLLLRVKVDEAADYYPIISGNKYRYSVRFMEPCEEKGQHYLNQKLTFQLAKC